MSVVPRAEPLDEHCGVCREIAKASPWVLYLYMVLAWTPWWPPRMRRFLWGHDFGCAERFSVP